MLQNSECIGVAAVQLVGVSFGSVSGPFAPGVAFSVLLKAARSLPASLRRVPSACRRPVNLGLLEGALFQGYFVVLFSRHDLNIWHPEAFQSRRLGALLEESRGATRSSRFVHPES